MIAFDKSIGNEKVCIVIRFYAAHIHHQIYSLDRTLKSFIDQKTQTKWEIFLFPTDTSNITGIDELINYYKPKLLPNGDQKITLVIPSNLKPYNSSNQPNLQAHIYNLTDQIISLCPIDTHWLLVTNGDNLYHPALFNYLNPKYDIIAYEFFSRWTNHNLPPCYRLTDRIYPVLSDVKCMRNKLKYAATDLGSNIINWKRFMNENRKYGTLIPETHPTYNYSGQDGVMIRSLVRSDWSFKQIKLGTRKRRYNCLVEHNPNYHSCVTSSSFYVWDDSNMTCLDSRKYNVFQDYYTYNLKRCIIYKDDYVLFTDRALPLDELKRASLETVF
jgi:hypothetical protein